MEILLKSDKSRTPTEREFTIKYQKLDKKAIHHKEELADTADRTINTLRMVHNRKIWQTLYKFS